MKPRHYFASRFAPNYGGSAPLWGCNVHLQVAPEAELPQDVAQRFVDKAADEIKKTYAPRKTAMDYYAEYLTGAAQMPFESAPEL